MNKKLSILAIELLLTVVAAAQVPFVCDGRFYMTQVYSSSNTRLVEVDIDPQTQEVTFRTIEASLGAVVNGIGYRSEENLIYGVNPELHFLYLLDAEGTLFELTRLNLLNGFFYLGADITPDGRFLVLIGSTDIDGIPVDDHMAFVDLEDPNYNVQIVRLTGELVNMLDVAFDPTDGTLYGFDSGGNRLVIILDDGTVVADFPPSPELENAGSLFFDVFGDLFAYGSPNGGVQTTLFSIDKNTGVFTPLTRGAEARATDACTCPFSVEVRKTVEPAQAIPCTHVQYSFAISNLSSRPQSGITFEDLVPQDFVITDIINNPFGGQVQSGPGTDFLQITDMTIPTGVDTLIIEVAVGEVPSGLYKNQAFLSGLPVGLGGTRLSDNPFTLPKRDSTVLVVQALDFDTLDIDTILCVGEPLVLDQSANGVFFLWEDMSTSAVREVVGAGRYVVQAASLCDTVQVAYNVSESLVEAAARTEATFIRLGDSVRLFGDILQATEEIISYQWIDPFGNSLTCHDCPNPVALPIGDVTYTLQVTNSVGCVSIADVFIEVDTETSIYAPNVFTPNGDAVNDIFFLQGKGLGQIDRLDIFNRWGGKVYSQSGGFVNDASIGWDGTIGDTQAEAAVYAWVAEVSYLNNTSTVVSGDVTLLR